MLSSQLKIQSVGGCAVSILYGQELQSTTDGYSESRTLVADSSPHTVLQVHLLLKLGDPLYHPIILSANRTVPSPGSSHISLLEPDISYGLAMLQFVSIKHESQLLVNMYPVMIFSIVVRESTRTFMFGSPVTLYTLRCMTGPYFQCDGSFAWMRRA